MKTRNFLYFIIPIIPILDNYSGHLTGINLGVIAAFLTLAYIAVYRTTAKGSLFTVTINPSSSALLLLLAYSVVITIVRFDYGFNVNTVLSIAINILIVVLLINKRVDISGIIRVYRGICVAATLYIMLQFILAYTVRIFLPGADILPFDLGDSSYFSPAAFYSRFGYIRLNSFFLEPAQYAKYVIPLLIISLFAYKKPDMKIGILASAGLIISTSGLGIVITCLAWTYYVFRLGKKNFIKFIITAVLFGCAAILIYVKTPISKLTANLFTANLASDSKAAERIYRGFAQYLQLPFGKQLFGIGLQNTASYVTSHGLTTIFDSRWHGNQTYINTMSKLLFETGIIGFAIYITVLWKQFKHRALFNKLLIIALLLVSCAASIYFSPIWLLYACFIISDFSCLKEGLNHEIHEQ